MMSLIFALEAAVNGPTGPRAILFDGLGRTLAMQASRQPDLDRGRTSSACGFRLTIDTPRFDAQ